MDEPVDGGDLLAGVSHHQRGVRRRRQRGKGVGPLGFRGVHDDLTALDQITEDVSGRLTSTHLQREFGVGRFGEATNAL